MWLRIVCVAMTLAVVTLLPAGAQSTTGMAAMQYYVGTWSCSAGTVGSSPLKTIETYAIESDIMREVYTTPIQGSMTKPYVSNLLTAYDAKQDRYVVVSLSARGSLTAGEVRLDGNTEYWTYTASSSGKLGRGVGIRTDYNHFTFLSYTSPIATEPTFKEICERS